MAVTPPGIVMPARPLQSSKVPQPMVLRLSGRVTAVSAVRPQKAYLLAEVTPSSITRR